MIQNDDDDTPMKLCTTTTSTSTPTTPSSRHCNFIHRVTNATIFTSFVVVFICFLSFAAFSSANFFSLSYSIRPFFTYTGLSPVLSDIPDPGPGPDPAPSPTLVASSSDPIPTRRGHILFGLSGSAATWLNRNHYSRLWWSPHHRGNVWLDREPSGLLTGQGVGPGYRVSVGPIGPGAKPSDRLARILKEGYDLGLPGVRWYVMGDDDTVFFTENLVAVLSKYDHRGMYYVGGSSESVEQVEMHGYRTAFGGGGFAISSGLATELVKILDGCIERYHYYYGSDEKVCACVEELGVTLTKEPGFHQFDIRGDPYGILAAHPMAPLVSLHHLDAVNPLFPGQTQEDSLKRLMKSYHIDPRLTLQQTFCYDHEREWSISVSWGYTAQLYPSLIPSRVLGTPFRTFRTWRSSSDGPFVFNTRPFGDDPCTKPVVYYVDKVEDSGGDTTLSSYKRAEGGGKCGELAYVNATMVEEITVTATKSGPEELLKAPRRRCCEITKTTKNNIEVKIRSCKQGESMST